MFSSYHFFFNGPLSTRALFSSTAFFALKRPSLLVSGDWEDDPTSLTSTLSSRLSSFFKALRNERATFESKPDVGIIDKSLQRVIFRIKAFFKATIGSVLILSFMTFGSVLCTTLTGLTLLSSPLLAFLFVILQFGSDILLYDRAAHASGPCWKLLKAVFVFAVPGILLGVVATIRHIVIHPILGMLHILWAFGRFFLRYTRDSLTGCVLFIGAKIPADDTFLAKRTQGPGLASLRHVRLPLAAAKASVELVLHQARVNAHVEFHIAMLLEPFGRYGEFLDSLLSPFESKSVILGASPESVCYALISSADLAPPYPSFHPKHQSTFQGLWDEIGNSIRRSHPDVKIASYIAQTLESNDIGGPTAKEYDFQMRANIRDRAALMYSSARSPHDVMSKRTGKLLADLQLRRGFRGKLFYQHLQIG
mmetsp:Transcript_17/g.30  ORF Transcript_17/g.30 Transcript_17/m.30 type:complete len:422 (+) Transcript_17:328-1593(+)